MSGVGVNYYRTGAVTGLPQALSKSIPLYDFIPKVDYTKKECPKGCSELGWKIAPSGLSGSIDQAVRAGKDVRGYFYWSLEDNLQWADGYAPKFGLFTKARKMRASAKVFRAETLRR